jgi:hypothetical protein
MKGTLKASTVGFYEGPLEQHVFPALGTRQVASMRRSDCRELPANPALRLGKYLRTADDPEP